MYAAFMDPGKAYNRVDREALCNVLKIYGVNGQLLGRIKAFYREASTCVRVDGELSEFPHRSGSNTRMCDIAMVK